MHARTSRPLTSSPTPTISDDLEADNASSRELQDPGSAVQNAVRCARSRSRVPGSSVGNPEYSLDRVARAPSGVLDLDPLSEIGSTASIQGPRSAPPKGPKSRVTRGADPES
eukprot:scaffold30718_cov63-Phaeocystis_antarctica.AAC.2